VPTKLQFVIGMDDADLQDPQSIRRRFQPLMIALEALTRINQLELRKSVEDGNPLPRLYESGVIYQEEPPGQEDWCDIRTILAQRWGDCEDLGCALVAERREYDGADARPVIKVKFLPREYLIKNGYPKKHIPRDGIFLVHVMCESPEFGLEDPSLELGMKGSYSNTQ